MCVKTGYSTSPKLSNANLYLDLITMVKKRVRDADVLSEAPAKASTQDSDSGSDEVIFNSSFLALTSPLTACRISMW